MSKKQPKSQIIIGVFVIVCALAGILYFKNKDAGETVKVVDLEAKPKVDFSNIKDKKNGPLVFLLGYLTEKQLESLKRGENVAKTFFEKNGMNIEFKYTEPDPARVVLLEPDWDFSIATSAVALAQYFNGVKMRPILWDNNCNLNVNLITLKDSNFYNPNDLAGKKVLIYNFGYYSPLELDAIDRWGIAKTDFYYTSDARRAYAALQNKQVDAVMSGVVVSSRSEGKMSYVFGKMPNPMVKEIAITDSKLPCRVVNASNATDPSKVKKMIELVKEIGEKKDNRALYPGILIDHTPISDEEFQAVLKKFDMKKLEPLKNIAKDFNDMQPADVPIDVPVQQSNKEQIPQTTPIKR